MQPRIATLLGHPEDTSTETGASHGVNPWPTGLTHRHDERTPRLTTQHSGFEAHEFHQGVLRSVVSHQQPGAPIAQVLNVELQPPKAAPSNAFLQSQVPTFSGKLVDVLLDPNQVPQRTLRVSNHHRIQGVPQSGDNASLTLPIPPQQVKKRPRIPPLLQGLHQPPPLPPAERLFPPITSDAGSYDGTTNGRRKKLEASGKRPEGVSADSGFEKASAKTSNQTSLWTNDPSPSLELRTPSSTNLAPPEPPSPTTTGLDSQESSKVNKKARKRNRWSEQETKDLVAGVKRFGIGSWKKILQCSDYQFEGRTAVDLKDRFRVLHPGVGLKSKAPLRAPPEETVIISKATKDGPVVVTEVPVNSTNDDEQDDLSETHNSSKGPFPKISRRPRRYFSAEDDENLLKGFQKYGSSRWHLIRDDKELGFNTRHATDLRDRFRIKYPDLFAKAGLKTKPDAVVKDSKQVPGERVSTKSQVASQPAPASDQHSRVKFTPPKSKDRPDLSALTTPPTVAPSSKVARIPPNPFELLPIDTYTFDFPDTIPIFSGDTSPITLNRDILTWADAQSGPSTVTLPNTNPTTRQFVPNPLVGDNPSSTIPTNAGPSYPPDILHINPLATLKLPNISSGFPSTGTNNSSSINPSILAPLPSANPASSAFSYSAAAFPAVSDDTDALLRTPNLPTLVFPQVPASSVRAGVLNLPAPADLLGSFEGE